MVKSEFFKYKWPLLLIVFPMLSAVLALTYHDFFFKAGVAGSGILILFAVYFRQFKASRDLWMILIAFLFSIGGDWFLSNRRGDAGMFVAGIGLFFVAHIGYLAYALLNGRLHRTYTLALLVVYLLFFFLKLYPSIDDRVLMVAALVYTLISCFSLGAAAGINGNGPDKWIYCFGILMLLFSDTIIALREFTAYRSPSFLILPTYYLSQISVTLSLLVRR